MVVTEDGGTTPDAAEGSTTPPTAVQASNAQQTNIQASNARNANAQANTPTVNAQQATNQSANSQLANTQQSLTTSTSFTSASVVTGSSSSGQPFSSSSKTKGRVVTTPSAVSSLSSASESNLSAPAPSKSLSPASDRLSNGIVAGLVVAIALGLAAITFVTTFFVMRRKRDQRKTPVTTGPEKEDEINYERKGPLVTATSRRPDSIANHLPQSADDATIQHSAEATLEQIGLHVENFYQNAPTSLIKNYDSELKAFDSTYLPGPLAVLLPRSKVATSLLKHTLAHLATSSISPSGSPTRSLLPAEFVLLPSTIESSKSTNPKLIGKSNISNSSPALDFIQHLIHAQLLSHPCRDGDSSQPIYVPVLWTILRTKPIVSAKSTVWSRHSLAYLHLGKIFRGAAELGILLFSQPSELQFHWPSGGSSGGSNKMMVTPALVKTTDEQGARLTVPQVLVEAELGRY